MTIDRTSSARAIPASALAYDDEFRCKLADAFMRAIVDGCDVDGVVVLRMHEIRDALIDVLAYLTSIEPEPRHARLVRSALERLRCEVAHHRRSGARARLHRQAASVVDVDRNRGGSA
jgi:hypothetical protein